MKKIMIALVILGLAVSNVFAETNNEIVQGFIDEKSALTGTLDIYDKDIDAVRTLKFVEFTQKDSDDGSAALNIHAAFLDTRSGDDVTVMFAVLNENEGGMVENYEIVEVQESAVQEVSMEERKETTDEEVMEAAEAYIEQQTKFSGYMNLFDPAKEALRKLEFVKFKGDVRRMGTMFFVTSHFKDMDSKEKLKVDFSIKSNEFGQLEVQNMALRGAVK